MAVAALKFPDPALQRSPPRPAMNPTNSSRQSISIYGAVVASMLLATSAYLLLLFRPEKVGAAYWTAVVDLLIVEGVLLAQAVGLFHRLILGRRPAQTAIRFGISNVLWIAFGVTCLIALPVAFRAPASDGVMKYLIAAITVKWVALAAMMWPIISAEKAATTGLASVEQTRSERQSIQRTLEQALGELRKAIATSPDKSRYAAALTELETACVKSRGRASAIAMVDGGNARLEGIAKTILSKIEAFDAAAPSHNTEDIASLRQLLRDFMRELV